MKHLVENKNDLNMVLKRINLQNSNISRFEGNLYRDGNRQTGAKVLLSVLRALKKETNKPVTELLVVIRSKKVGGATYKIPVHLHKPKEVPLAVKTLVSNSCGRKLGLSSRNLEKELLLVLKGEGTTLYKRNALHTLAFNNRAYVKYL
jgi:small subunit ribosomal protein S7